MPGTDVEAVADAGADGRALFRLLSWFSPNYPIGAFSCSHGLESAVDAGIVSDPASLETWIRDVTRRGVGRVETVLLAEAWRAADAGDFPALHAVADLAAAWRPTAELAVEGDTQGDAFLAVAEAAWPSPSLFTFTTGRGDRPTPHPVAVGVVAAAHRIPLPPTATAFLFGFATGLVSVGVRLGIIGQTGGQRVIAALEPEIAATAAVALATPLDEAGAATPVVDWCSMRHETQYTRLFRS